jgi:hypothetical protein
MMTFDALKNNLAVILSAGALLILSGCTTTDITSSTSSTLDTVTPDVTLNRFVDVRIASIKKEAATGEGENLEALAHLMGKQDKVAFSGWMLVHFDELFNNLGKPEELISRINQAYPQSVI